MIRQQITRIRIILGALALGSLLTQLVIVPRFAAEYAAAYPEVAYLALPYVTAMVVAIGGFEVALLAAWLMLSTAGAGRALTSRSKRWANVMTASLSFMAVIFSGVCVHAGSFAAVGGPAMLFGLLTSLALLLIAFGLRNQAMRFLLRDDVDAHVSR
jgi:cytochrome bd-type quinol oxidase subunit 2